MSTSPVNRSTNIQSTASPQPAPTALPEALNALSISSQNASALNPAAQDLTNTFAPIIQRLQELEKQEDIYSLFKLEIPELKQNPQLFNLYKQAIKTALKAFTFFDPGATTRARNIIAGKYNLVKLTGADYRDLQHRMQALEQNPSQEKIMAILPEYEGSSSPFRLDGGKTFKMTPDAAKALCQVVKDDPSIDALILRSLPDIKDEAEVTEENKANWTKESFGDEVATILATDLPEERFKLLTILGGFGDQAQKILDKILPTLISKSPIDPKDIQIAGLGVSEETFEQSSEKFQTYIAKRRAENPESIVNKRDACIIM